MTKKNIVIYLTVLTICLGRFLKIKGKETPERLRLLGRKLKNIFIRCMISIIFTYKNMLKNKGQN